MKKIALVLLICVWITPAGYSATVIKDPDIFYAIFEKPDTVIDFLKLKDGTSFDKIPDSYRPNTAYLDNPDKLVVYTGESDGVGRFELIAVRSQAFSDDWSFRGVHPTEPEIFRENVVWFDQGITTGSFEMIITATTRQSQPFVIYTEKGFVGIVPSSPEETRFIFEDLHVIFSFETGFSIADAEHQSPDIKPFWRKLKYQWI